MNNIKNIKLNNTKIIIKKLNTFFIFISFKKMEFRNFIYVRTSGKHKDAVSIKSQIEALKSLARNDYVIYKDKGISVKKFYNYNKTVNRKIMINEISKCKEQNINIFIYDVSRFTRSVDDVVCVLKLFKSLKKNVSFVTPLNTYKVFESSGRDGFLREVIQAEREYMEIIKRVNSSVNFRKIRGDVFGVAPFGFKAQKDETGKRIFVHNPEELEIVEKIIDLYYSDNLCIEVFEHEYENIKQLYLNAGYELDDNNFSYEIIETQNILLDRKIITLRDIQRGYRHVNGIKLNIQNITTEKFVCWLNVLGYKIRAKNWTIRTFKTLLKNHDIPNISDIKI